MSDLTEASHNAGFDWCGIDLAHATDTGRVAVHIGAAWQVLPLDKALNPRDQLDVAINQLRSASEVAHA